MTVLQETTAERLRHVARADDADFHNRNYLRQTHRCNPRHAIVTTCAREFP
jgi:hypothetical protein